MPIQIACRDCGKRYRFADERSGETTVCKECGGTIEIPGVSRNGKKKKKSKKQSNLPVILSAIGGALGVAACAIGASFLLASKPPAAPNVPPAGVNQPVAGGPAQPLANPTSPPAPVISKSDAADSVSVAPPGPVPQGIAASPPAAVDPGKPLPAGSGFKTNSQVQDFAPTKDWNVQIDPVTEPFDFDEAARVEIKTVSGYLQNHFVTYPNIPSPFVLVGQNGSAKEAREVWNLATGKKAGVIKGPTITGNSLGFSPDGAYVGWFRFDNAGGIEVYDIKAKKSLGTVAVDSQKFNVARVCLPSSKRLVALSNVHRSILTWKLPSGDLEWQITMGANGQPDPRFAFSPGGRFLAVVADFLTKAIDFYDLETGKKAGSIEFAGRGPDLFGLAFSLDGKKFAAAYAESFTDKAERIVVWNVADGKIDQDFELPDPEQRKRDMLNSKSSLQWFPDGERLLLNGEHVVELASKSVVFSLPPVALDFATSLTRRVLSNTAIASWDGTNKSATLTKVSVLASDIARAKEVAAEGGLMVDVNLPKLTLFDRSQAQSSAAVSGSWKDATDTASVESKLPDTLSLRTGTGHYRELEFSRPESGVIAVRIAEEENTSQARFGALRTHVVSGGNRNRIRTRIPPVACQKNKIELYNAIKQMSLSQFDVEFPCELMAVNPSGSRVLVQAMEGSGRLDVFDAMGGHIAGCRPFQDEAEPQRREIASACFIDENTVAACSIDDHLIVFQLPTCKPLYTVADAGTVAVSPHGKFLATSAQNKIEVRDALSGGSRGSITVKGDVQAISFAPGGDRLAALSTGRRGTTVVLVDLASGEATLIPTPQASSPLIWCGENEILIGNPAFAQSSAKLSDARNSRSLMLLDLKRKGILWSYSYGTEENFALCQKTVDGRLWFAGADSHSGSGQFAALKLPEPAAIQRTAGKEFNQQTIVSPGSAVGLKMQVEAPQGLPEYPQKVQKQVENAIRANGLSVKPDAPVQLVVSIAPANVSGTFTLQSLGTPVGQNPKTVSIQRKGATVRVAYESKGTSIWESRHELQNDFFGITRVPEGKDLQALLDEQLWERAIAIIESSFPPDHVFSPQTSNGFGVSRLLPSGLQTIAE